VCTVAYVCHRAGWLADSLADSATVSSEWPNGLRNQDSGGSPLLVIAYAEMPSGSESRGITPDVCGVRCQMRLPDADPAFDQALGEFRAAVGTQLAHIAAAFGLDVEEPLLSILPAPDQDADTPSPRTPRETIADHGWSGNLEPRVSLVIDRVCGD
jgi:hypothetical protein